MTTQKTILASNTIFEKLRKHLLLSNFYETPKTSVPTKITTQTNPQKTFSFDSITTDNVLNAHINITPSQSYLNSWLIKLLDTFFNETLLIDAYTLKLNFLGCIKDQQNYSKKKDINSKNSCNYSQALCSPCQQEWARLLNTLQILSINFVVDQSLLVQSGNPVKLLFEFSSNSNNQKHVIAHGIYQDTNQSNESSIQAQINVDALIKILPNLATPNAPALHLIIPQQEAQINLALLIAAMLHHAGKCFEIQHNASSNINPLDATYTTTAKYLIFCGDAEQKTGTVIIKNLVNNTQAVVKQAEILNHIQ